MTMSTRCIHWSMILFMAAALTRSSFVSAQQTGSVTSSATTSTRISLAASNPFRMVMRPTPFELDFVALSIVEEAMAAAILLSADSSLVDVNININQMNWLSPSDASENGGELIDGTVLALGADEVPTTVLKFFAVGTFLTNTGTQSGSGSLAAVKKLDEIVKKAFLEENIGALVNLLRNSGDPLLEGVRDVVAIPTNNNDPAPAPSPSIEVQQADDEEDGGISLTTMDIVLIAVSASIFLGIVYMIFQHHKDRGYIENQRIQTINAYHRNHETSSTYTPRNNNDASRPRAEKSTSSANESTTSEEGIKPMSPASADRQGNGEQPSHSSSLFTSSEDHSFATSFSLPPSPTDINTHLNSRMNRYSSKLRLVATEEIHSDSRSLPPAPKKSMTSASSVQSVDDRSECKSMGAISTAFSTLSAAEFGPINWFRNKSLSSKGLSSSAKSVSEGSVANIEEGREEDEEEASGPSKPSTTSSSSSSSSSDDVFHVAPVKTNVIAAGSIANGSETVVSKNSSIVTDWMKTIQVISSSDSKSVESEVTCKASSSEQSSTAENSELAPSVGEGMVEDVDAESLEHSLANSRGMVGISAMEEGATMMEF